MWIITEDGLALAHTTAVLHRTAPREWTVRPHVFNVEQAGTPSRLAICVGGFLLANMSFRETSVKPGDTLTFNYLRIRECPDENPLSHTTRG